MQGVGSCGFFIDMFIQTMIYSNQYGAAHSTLRVQLFLVKYFAYEELQRNSNKDIQDYHTVYTKIFPQQFLITGTVSNMCKLGLRSLFCFGKRRKICFYPQKIQVEIAFIIPCSTQIFQYCRRSLLMMLCSDNFKGNVNLNKDFSFFQFLLVCYMYH